MASWDEISSAVPDVAILRRILFAAAHLPNSMPKYAEVIVEFAFSSCKIKPKPEKVRVLLENLPSSVAKHLILTRFSQKN